MKTNLALIQALVGKGYEVYYFADDKYKTIVEESRAVFVPYKTDLKPFLEPEIADYGLNNVLRMKLEIL